MSSLDPTNESEAAADPSLTETLSRRVADVLVEQLVSAGAKVMFGLPGGAISPMHDALHDRSDVRVITTRLEAGAMFAAAGYARMTGAPGVVLVTAGPGVLNSLTGLASAYAEGLPVILIAGEAARNRFGKNALQDGSSYGMDIVAMARPITKMSMEIRDPDLAPSILAEAIRVSVSGRRGPVLLTLPTDVGTSRIRAPKLSHHVESVPAIDGAAIAAVVEVLEHAKRPVIFAGPGVMRGDGPEHLTDLASKLNFPVMTTPTAKGAISEDHPLALGVFGFGSNPSTIDYLSGGVDVVLAIGTGLGEASTNGWSPLLVPTKHLIQIDSETLQLGKSYKITHGLSGNISAILGELNQQIHSLPAVVEKFGIRRHENAALMTNGPEGLIAPPRALWELQQLMPANTLYTLDIGEHMLFGIHYLEIKEAFGFGLMLGLGSMASGIGSALGVKLGRPDRPVVAICGDGGFSMAIGDVATAARENIPLVVAVFNDERYGMVEIGHESVYGRRISYPSGTLDIARLAQGVGAQSLLVEHAGELESLDLLSRLEKGPVVIDIRIDRAVRMPQNARNKYLKTAIAENKRIVN